MASVEAAIRRSPELVALKERFSELRTEMAAHERAAVDAILDRMKVEVAELARAQGLDVVLESHSMGEPLFRAGARYPIGGPTLTDELIRMHDERFP